MSPAAGTGPAGLEAYQCCSGYTFWSAGTSQCAPTSDTVFFRREANVWQQNGGRRSLRRRSRFTGARRTTTTRPRSSSRQANAADPAIFERFSEDRFPECFKEYADLLTWDAYWHTTLDTSNPPFWKWFVGGRLNACYNCVDRHLATQSQQGGASSGCPSRRPRTTQAITYQELYSRVNEFAALLRDFCGLKAGDRVTFHMPMVPELPVSMLACARLGVDPLRGVRRVQRRGLRRPDRRLGQPRPGDDGRLLPQRRADRPQGQGRRGGRRRRANDGVEVDKVLVWRRHPGQYASKTPMVDGPRLLRRRAAGRLPRRAWSSRCRCPPRRRCS